MLTAVIIIAVFGVLIFFHELGHFLAARSLGIGVNVFSLGFGPRLFGWRGKKTDYRISLLPLGGFVMLAGIQPGESLPEGFTERESFSLRGPAQRFLVIAAGAVFNIILAWIIFCAESMMTGKPLVLPDGTVPHSVELGAMRDDSPAALAGLKPGDIIISINGAPVGNISEVPAAVVASGGQTVLMEVERRGKRLEVAALPRLDESGEKPVFRIGVQLLAVPQLVPVGLGEAVIAGSRATVDAAGFIANALGRLVSGKESVKNLGGPILIAQEIGHASESGLHRLFLIMALLSVNLGLLNLLPIPILDGGHLLFLIVEMIARRPLPEKVRVATGYAGLAFLVGIMLLATYNDILRLLS